MPEVQAHLADGTILHFPDGTDPSIVQGAVQNYLKAPTQQTKPDDSGWNLHDFLTGKGGLIREGGSQLKDAANDLTTPGSRLKGTNELLQGATKLAAPVAIGASIPGLVSGGLAGLLPSLARFATTAGTGYAAGKVAGGVEGALGAPKDLSDLTETLGNFAGGIAGDEGVTAAKALISRAKGGVLSPELENFAKLKPTLSQWMQKLSETGDSGIAGHLQPAAKMAEDYLTPGAKAADVKASGQLAYNQMIGQGADLSGRAPSVVANPTAQAMRVQVAAENTLKAYENESNSQAQIARLVAEGAPQPLSDGSAIVKGPTQIQSTLQTAKSIVDRDGQNIRGTPPDSIASVNEAHRLLSDTRAKFDDQGQLISADPLNFGEAWDWKQQYGGAARFNSDQVTGDQRNFASLFHTMNDDIEGSIPSWDTPQKLAMNSWKNAKATVEERINLFNPPDGKGAPNLADLIENSNDPSPTLTRLLGDSQALKRALKAGYVQFPSGKVYSNNLRNDAGAFQIQKLLAGNTNLFAKGGKTIDADGLYRDWNNPQNYEVNRTLFNGQECSTITDFARAMAKKDQAQNPNVTPYVAQSINPTINNIATTQTSGTSSFGQKIFWVRNGLYLGGAILGGHLGGIEGASAAAGAELGATALTRALTRPGTAELMVRLAKGQPLQVSSASFANRLFSAIKGSLVTIVGQDGARQKGTFDKDGQFTPQTQP